MVAYSFNAQQFTPQYSGGGGLPAGPNGEDVIYDVMIVESAPVDTKDNFGNTTGGYLELVLASTTGPTQGTRHSDRLNLMHKKPQVAEIANKQLSAYCHVLGKFQFNDTAELHNIPFKVKIGLQKGPEAKEKGYTEVKAVYDANGNEPGKAGSGPQAGAQQQGQVNIPPAGGVTAQGGGWGGGNPGQGQGGAPIDNNVPMGGGQGQPQQGGGFGAPNNGQPQQGQGGGWGQPNGGQQPQQGGQPQGGGWGQGGGQPQQGQGGAPAGQQGGQPGWGQGQGGGAPGWGQGQG